MLCQNTKKKAHFFIPLCQKFSPKDYSNYTSVTLKSKETGWHKPPALFLKYTGQSLYILFCLILQGQ